MNVPTRNFFVLEHAVDGIGRGGYPQHQTMGKEYQYLAEDSVQKLPHNHLADFTPNLNSIILTKGVKLTDLISSAPIPWYALVVSEKLLNILSKFQLPPHKVYSAPVLHGTKSILGYFVIHIPAVVENLQHLDFGRSRFWIRGIITHKKIEEIHLSSVTELNQHDRRAKNLHGKIWAEYFSMTDDFLSNIDMFSLPEITFPVGFYVSNELRYELEANHCTGLRLIETTDKKKIFSMAPDYVSVLQV